MDHETSHVCGGLPVSTILALVTRCHHHEAYTLSVQMVHQTDDEPAVVSSIRIPFGPFDDLEQITRLTTVTLESFVAELAEFRPTS